MTRCQTGQAFSNCTQTELKFKMKIYSNHSDWKNWNKLWKKLHKNCPKIVEIIVQKLFYILWGKL